MNNNSFQQTASHRWDLSIVVPTFKEAENLPELFTRIASTLDDSGISAEVIVVDDDSQDGTEFVCQRYGSSLPIRLFVRQNERGLASAVVRGMEQAGGELLCVMDADLSHPPERIPAIVECLKSSSHDVKSSSHDEGSTDFVIGSRYVDGGSTTDDWGFLRWLNSKIATLAARPFTSATDPMAGFFALRRSDFIAAESELNPIGYKIGLELIVKAKLDHVAEVPIEFCNRVHGESKLTIRERMNYLKHLASLFRFKHPKLGRAMLLPSHDGASADRPEFSSTFDSTGHFNSQTDHNVAARRVA